MKRQQKKKITQLEDIYRKVLTKAWWLKRYRQRVKRYRHNRTFENNKRKFNEKLGDDTKTCQRYFQGDALSPLLFIFALIPTNLRLRKSSAGYELSKSREKINHLIYRNDIKLFAKKKKKGKNIETPIHAVRIYSQDIGMEFGLEKWAMLVINDI